MKIWNDVEVKALFDGVENCKKQNFSLVRAFESHAKKFSRKPNSVRNYYYHEVDNLAADKVRAARLRIDITKHQKSHFKNFDKMQEGELFDEIDRLTSNGFSVRSACLKLSGGDLALMTRYQNKYQNMKRKIENNQNSNNFSKKGSGKAKKSPLQIKVLKEKAKDSKIIPFKMPYSLSDADINSLFLGLVKLIKKSAQEETAENFSELKNVLNKKESELKNLKQEFERIKTENLALLSKVQENAHLDKKLALEKHLAKPPISVKAKSSLQNMKRD